MMQRGILDLLSGCAMRLQERRSHRRSGGGWRERRALCRSGRLRVNVWCALLRLAPEGHQRPLLLHTGNAVRPAPRTSHVANML